MIACSVYVTRTTVVCVCVHVHVVLIDVSLWWTVMPLIIQRSHAASFRPHQWHQSQPCRRAPPSITPIGRPFWGRKKKLNLHKKPWLHSQSLTATYDPGREFIFTLFLSPNAALIDWHQASWVAVSSIYESWRGLGGGLEDRGAHTYKLSK